MPEGDNATVTIKDIPWGLARLGRKGVMSGLPIPAHLSIARIRGEVARRFSAPSPVVQENLRSALAGCSTEQDMERIGKDYAAFRKQLYLWRVLPLHPRFRSAGWPVAGLEVLESARSRGCGVILVTAHLGFPHMIPSVLSTHGFEVRQVLAEVDRLEKKQQMEKDLRKLSKLRQYIHGRTNIRLDSIGPMDIVAGFDARPILTALRDGEILLIAGDGLRSTQFVHLSLLGRPYPFSPGFMKIAIMTAAEVIPVFAVYDEEQHRIRIDIQEALPVSKEKSMEQNLELFAQVLEEQIRRTPHLWHRWNIPNWFDHAVDWSSKAGTIDPYRERRDEHVTTGHREEQVSC